MTAPDYPLPALGGYETYQLAYIATYVAERLARHRQSGRGRDGRATRAEAVRDLAGAATALANATGTTVADADVPRPLDRDTFTAARELLTTGPRTADVVALAGTGQSGFAVVGHVPGVGAVGARVASKDLADAMRTHFLTQPADDLAAWAVTEAPQRMPTLPQQVDLAAFVEHLDPARDNDRAVARNLRGHSRRTDAAIRGRFAHVDLDAPAILTPPAQPGSGSRAQRRQPLHTAQLQATALGRRRGLRPPAHRRPEVQESGAPARGEKG